MLSDLHLSADTPRTQAHVRTQLTRYAGPDTAFVLLGDIFEYWVGDDHDTPIARAFKELCEDIRAAGSTLYFMAGNRDFLVGDAYLNRCGIVRLPDPWHGELFGIPTLLTHGDLLCTDDQTYQQFRRMSRSTAWQQAFLAQPLAERVAYAQRLRAESMKKKAGADDCIMDVNRGAVESALNGQWPDGQQTPPAKRLIHGHTHRPACHTVETPGGRCERWVLPDWWHETATDPSDPSDQQERHRGYVLQLSDAGVRVLTD